MPLILSGVKKFFGDHLIVAVDSFHFDQGAYWIQGINGAGKTTLLKTIAGMLPFEGDIAWNDLHLRKSRRQYLEQVSYAPAEPLYPEFISGRELIEFYTECRNADVAQVNELLNICGVKDFADGKTGTYSTGMVKKLSLMLAFIGNPSVVLLDEPLITIDKDSVHFIYDLMHSFMKEKENVLIFTSHQSPVETVLPSLKTVELREGKLVIV